MNADWYRGTMPVDEERRSGTTRYRTIRVGKGKRQRRLHIAIVPKGGHTSTGQPQVEERARATQR